MLMAVDRAPTFRRALLLGWWAGVVETAGGFYWLIDVMQRFADFPWVAAAAVLLLFCAARALIFLLFTAASCAPCAGEPQVPMTLLAPMVMVSCELLVPQLFPCGQWITQAWHPLVIQITELTGPLGVTALLMLVNGALYDLLVDARAARYPAIAAALLLAAALIFGAVRMRQVDAAVAHAPRSRSGWCSRTSPTPTTENSRATKHCANWLRCRSNRGVCEQAGAQLLVWSEGSYPVALPRDFSADFPADSSAMIRRGFSAPTLVGADMFDAAHDEAFNSAILMGIDGRVADRYDKVRLLAFGEYIPGIDYFPWLRKFLPAGAGRFTAGAGPGVLSLQAPGGKIWRLGPVICYEDILPGLFARASANCTQICSSI